MLLTPEIDRMTDECLNFGAPSGRFGEVQS
jgi:hypothetical protein